MKLVNKVVDIRMIHSLDSLVEVEEVMGKNNVAQGC
jgi:hypothetical protein